MCDDHASYLQLQVYIQACNDVTTRSLSYCIVFYIAARYKTGPEFILHSASHGTTSFRFNIYGNFFQKLCLQRGASYISHRLYFRHFFTFFGKNGFRSFLTNGRTDFRPDFADFRNFSGPYDGHTYSPPKKKHGNGRTDPAALKKPRTDTDCI